MPNTIVRLGDRRRAAIAPERRERKLALWDVYAHSADVMVDLLPPTIRPGSLQSALAQIHDFDDHHGQDRRWRVMRRLNHELYAPPHGPIPDAKDVHKTLQTLVGRHSASARRADRAQASIGRKLCGDLGAEVLAGRASGAHRAHAGKSGAQAKTTLASAVNEPICVPRVNAPRPNRTRGVLHLYSKIALNAKRPLNRKLAKLLDPRWWPHCSDLFDETFEVEERDGAYVQKPQSVPIGHSWSGLMYEYADIGPLGIENILTIDYTAIPGCPGWGQRKLPPACTAEKCNHGIESLSLRYDLYDSLSYLVGGLTLPGVMRQNYGTMKVLPSESPDEGPTIEYTKTVRFGRLTRWSVGGGLDFGEVLNDIAPAFLALWTSDIQQIVPCCDEPDAGSQGGDGSYA